MTDGITKNMPGAGATSGPNSLQGGRSDAVTLADQIVNGMPASFYVYDDQRHLVRWNKRLSDVTGYSAEELRNKDALSFFDGEDRVVIAEAIAQVLSEGRAETEATIVTKGGQRLRCYFTCVRAMLDGRPHFVGLGIDITERTKAEAALVKSEARFREMAELLPEVLFESDLQGNLTYANQIGFEKTGYSRADLERGLHILDMVVPADRARAWERMSKLVSGSVKTSGEYTALRKDGSTFPMTSCCSPIIESGRTVGFRGIMVDTTERVKTERNLASRADRIMRCHKCLLKLSRVDFTDLGSKIREITEADAEAMQVERASVWFFNDARTSVACEDLFKRKEGTHEKGPELKASLHPRYFEALIESRVIAAADACSDPRTSEFAEDYLKLFGITSMLDAPVWLHGKIIGIVCHEHVGPARTWLPEEQDFAASIADMVSLSLEAVERKRAEEALGRSEEEFSQLVENVPIGIYRSTPDGRMLMANPTMVKMLGYSTFAELATQDLEHECRHHGYARGSYREKIEREGRVVGQEYVWTRTDGSLIHVRENARAIFDETGKAKYYEGTIEDISEQKRAEAELKQYQEHLEDLVKARTSELEESNRQLHEEIHEREQLETDLIQAREAAEAANRAKSVFLANMSHGIRTPMNAILGYTQILQRDPAVGKVQREYVDVISRSGEHLLGLINDILEMSKIEAGRATLNLEEFDLLALLDEIGAMFRVRTDEKNLSLEVKRAGSIPRYLYADSGKIREVMINLLGNAVKFTDRGSISVKVTAADCEGQPNPMLCMEFADTGCGIAGDEIARAFEPFEQTRSGRFQGSGTGLGLPISREYARMMGGDLTVESVVGTGSTFHFTFRAKVARASDIRRNISDYAGQVVGLVPNRPAPKVLVVDDDEASREALRLHLEIVGFDVREASNGKEAVAITEEWRPEVVLMDLWMPEMDGLEATRRIKASPAGPTTAILAVTASVLEESEKEAVSAGADGFIRKPFRKAEVFSELRRVLGVEYLYEESRAKADDNAWGTDRGKPDVPAALIRDLSDAAESGDGLRLRRLLEEHRSKLGAELAQSLGDLANGYQYAEVLQALAGLEVAGRAR